MHNSEDKFSKNKGISENEVEKEPIKLDPKQDMFLGMMQINTAHKWYVKCTILIDNSFSITNIAMNYGWPDGATKAKAIRVVLDPTIPRSQNQVEKP